MSSYPECGLGRQATLQSHVTASHGIHRIQYLDQGHCDSFLVTAVRASAPTD
ncbi:hypothetical protein CBOM_03160 [Ceraceosorus bombacis]|uniref:Uncharacterized protein n=1 Tax=Ceraceosorus bombacis TaxID=401625 RepID=A0A0N7LAN6_9BASI|nr:hypothetical protein CBOM_03160 [Ceraceosorus bombacis]